METFKNKEYTQEYKLLASLEKVDYLSTLISTFSQSKSKLQQWPFGGPYTVPYNTDHLAYFTHFYFFLAWALQNLAICCNTPTCAVYLPT